MVTAVFDPDGTGSDFSYTAGLARDGLPELHMWARPDLGDDPGLDWKFSQRDTCWILNRLAWRLLDGRLAVGDAWMETYDEGLVEAHFSVHEPVAAEELDALGAGNAPVLPIKWELRRAPVGAPKPMDAVAQAEAAATYDEIVSPRSSSVAPPGWDLPATPSWGADGRFGPRTPLVLARARQLWSAPADQWVAIADHVVVARDRVPTGYALSVSHAAARAAGRVAEVERLESAVEDLMAGFGITWGVPHLAELRAWFGRSFAPGPESDDGWRYLLDQIALVVTGHLVVESLVDVLSDRVTRLGQGILLTALGPPGAAPDSRWLCSPTVDRAITDLIARTPLTAMVESAAAWDRTFWDQPGLPIVVTSWTGAGCSRPVFELLDVASCVVAAGALESRGLGLGALQVWLTSLATVLTERASLDQSVVDLFLDASRQVVGLERLVNSPLTTEVA